MKKLLYIMLIGFCMMIYFLYSSENEQREIDKDGLENLDLQMTGVVTSVDPGDNFHGRGIVRLRIISSNIQEYDPRGKQPFYFCVIKDGIAELYTQTFLYKVDTVYINTNRKLIRYFEDGDYQEGSISISTEAGYYKYIEKHTIFR